MESTKVFLKSTIPATIPDQKNRKKNQKKKNQHNFHFFTLVHGDMFFLQRYMGYFFPLLK